MQDDYDSQPGSPGPSKRRRYSRVSRACNECRVRKIRCNGRQPCEPCEDFERHCTFTSTKGQRVAGAPRTKILEDRLRRARALITKLQSQNPSAPLTAEVNSIFDSPPGSPSSVSDTTGVTDEGPGEYLESMMDGKGRLLLNQKSATYYGGGSGLAFLQKTLKFFSQSAPGIGTVSPELQQTALSSLYDSPLWETQTLPTVPSSSDILPSRRTASDLLDVFFGNAYHLVQFMHEPTIRTHVDRIYDLDPMDFEELDHDFLPLFHSVMALGYLFNQKMHQKHSCKGALDQAMRHFITARRMIELNRCRDILGLQAIVCLALFLMSTSRLATAHTMIGVAVSASMRMGLHSQASSTGSTPLSREIKIRVFWTVVKLDIYASIILGLPCMIDLAYVDQLKPSGFCRDYSNEENGGFASIASRQKFAASAQYLELLLIIRRLMKRFYPKTDEEAENSNPSKGFTVNSAAIDEMKEEFKNWREGLADALGPSDGHDSLSSMIYELEMVHNCGHLLLYRPFLHYLAKTKSENPPDPRLLQCATSCVKISRFTIIRSEEIFSQGSLSPASWQSIYIIFLSLVTLVYFLATQHGNREYLAIQKEAERGIRLLHGTSCLDNGSRRCLDALKVLIAKQSHLVDLDVDKLSEGVTCVCHGKIWRSNEHHLSQQKQIRPEHDPQLLWTKGEIVGNTPTPPMQPNGNRQFAYRSHVPPNLTIPTTNNPAIVPIYQSQRMAYSTQLPVWDHSAAILNSAQNPFFTGPAIPYQTPTAQSYKQKYGETEMELLHPDPLAWPFQPDAGLARVRSGGEDSTHHSTVHEGYEDNLEAFVGNDMGEEPFI